MEKLSELLHPKYSENLFHAASALETLARHSLEVAEENSTGSWALPGDEVVGYCDRARLICKLIREIGWDLSSFRANQKIKELGLDAGDFTEMYLKPNADGSPEGYSDFVSNYILGGVNFYDEEIVASYIANMDYKVFLKTPYWKYISAYCKNGKRCALCDSELNLEVHHPSYDFHGLEHKNTDRLVVLCHDCHAMFHNKKK